MVVMSTSTPGRLAEAIRPTGTTFADAPQAHLYHCPAGLTLAPTARYSNQAQPIVYEKRVTCTIFSPRTPSPGWMSTVTPGLCRWRMVTNLCKVARSGATKGTIEASSSADIIDVKLGAVKLLHRYWAAMIFTLFMSVYMSRTLVRLLDETIVQCRQA
jgi:hypothetical protein